MGGVLFKAAILLFVALLGTAAPCVAQQRLLLQQHTANSSAANASCIPPHTSEEALRLPFCAVPALVSQKAQIVLRAAHSALPLQEQLGIGNPDQLAQQRANVTALFTNALMGTNVSDFIQQRRNVTLGGVPSVIATPVGASTKDTALFWLHGGGYFFGTCYSDALMTVAGIAKAAGMAIVCPEYRLAPEHPFPAALNDSVAAYQALLQQYSPKKVAVVGDSAGGGLVMALLQRLHQQGIPMPAAVGLLSPWTDLAAKGDTLNTLNGVDPVLTSDGTPGSLALAYVGGNSQQLQDPLVSPVYANYSKAAIGQLPPTLVQVGLRETVLSDSVNLYRALVRGGQRATISPWEGMWHDFLLFATVPEAQEASREMAAFFKQAIR